MGKLCTRQHFIEYLSYNHVEKQCLLARCLWERYQKDYGKDGYIQSVAENGEVEDGQIDVQVKATDFIERRKKSNNFYFDVEKKVLDRWFNKFIPMLLVLYDAQSEKAYYIEIRQYFKQKGLAVEQINKFVRLFIPEENILTPDAILQFRKFKNENL